MVFVLIVYIYSLSWQIINTQPKKGGGKMRFHEIQTMAKDMGINTFRMKKTDIIQFIQRKENNIDCYGTERVAHCEELGCLWRIDCLSLNNHGKVK